MISAPRTTGLLLLLLALPLPLLAQGEPSIFGEIIDVRVVNLEVVVTEKGERLRARLEQFIGNYPELFELVRGKGLMQAIEIVHAGGYEPDAPTTAALLDPNVIFPVDRARELVEAGRLGGLVDEHVGLNGHIDGKHVTALVERSAPVIAAHFRDQRADIVLLAPA